jgi:hypothetical protein
MKPTEIDLGFTLDESKIMALNLPIENVPMKAILANADICYLEKEGTDDWNLSPNELIRNFKVEITHAKRAEQVNLAYPIAIYYFKGKWIILDGVHRFTKALMLGRKTIAAIKVPAALISSLRRAE